MRAEAERLDLFVWYVFTKTVLQNDIQNLLEVMFSNFYKEVKVKNEKSNSMLNKRV